MLTVLRLTNMNSDMIIGAVKIDYLPVPDRSTRGTMPFNPSQGLARSESRLMRAVKALPFLTISATAFYLMCVVSSNRGTYQCRADNVQRALPHMITRSEEMMDKGVDSTIGLPGHVQPLHNFYGLEFMDSRIKGLAACFASFQFVDHVANWQGFTLLTDLGVMYAIVLIEGARHSNHMTFASM
jgi:hypothetical protein